MLWVLLKLLGTFGLYRVGPIVSLSVVGHSNFLVGFTYKDFFFQPAVFLARLLSFQFYIIQI